MFPPMNKALNDIRRADAWPDAVQQELAERAGDRGGPERRRLSGDAAGTRRHRSRPEGFRARAVRDRRTGRGGVLQASRPTRRRTSPLRGGRNSRSCCAANFGGGMPHRAVTPIRRRFGKVMRQTMTDAEVRLWLRLRKPGIDGLRFRRQVPIGPYIVDFFCPQHRLIVEIDGGQHANDDAAARDRERDAWLARHGYRVVRAWNNDVMDNLEASARPSRRRRGRAQPSPPPEIADAISTSPQGGGSGPQTSQGSGLPARAPTRRAEVRSVFHRLRKTPPAAAGRAVLGAHHHAAVASRFQPLRRPAQCHGLAGLVERLSGLVILKAAQDVSAGIAVKTCVKEWPPTSRLLKKSRAAGFKSGIVAEVEG